MEVLSVNDAEFVTLAQAKVYTGNFRDDSGEPEGLIKGLFVGKNKINALLDQTDIVGIRIYYGINSEGKTNLVLVGALSNGDDVTDLIVEKLRPCPPYCGKANDLNGD